MADETNNPHGNTSTDAAKHISLELLNRYHHHMVDKLGLLNDNGKYYYGGQREDGLNNDEINGQTSAQVLDWLFDNLKSGQLELNDGYTASATKDAVPFSEADAENKCYINAKIGDDTINIELDANNFLKDEHLVSVDIVSVTYDEDENVVYKKNGVAIEELPTGVTPSKYTDKDGVEHIVPEYFLYYTWETKNGKKESTYRYDTISFYEMSAQITTDDYLVFRFNTLYANTAYVEKENNTTPVTTTSASFDYGQGSSSPVDADAFKFTLEDGTELVVPGFHEEGSRNIEVVGSDGNTYNVYLSLTREATESMPDGTWSWSIARIDGTSWEKTDDGLIDAVDVAYVAQDLQDQIDEVNKHNTLADGTVNLAADESALTAKTTGEGSSYELDLPLASDDDIDALFNDCPRPMV